MSTNRPCRAASAGAYAAILADDTESEDGLSTDENDFIPDESSEDDASSAENTVADIEVSSSVKQISSSFATSSNADVMG